MKKERGFTLVEMIIVMAVIAALTAIAIPVTTSIVQKARGTKVASKMDQIANAAISYYAENASTPTSLASLSDYLKTTGLDNYSIYSTSATFAVDASPLGLYSANPVAYDKAESILSKSYSHVVLGSSSGATEAIWLYVPLH